MWRRYSAVPWPERRAAVFDMDGTLLDTLGDITDAVNAAMRFARVPERTRDEVRAFIGNGARRLIERSLPPDASRETQEATLRFYRAFYDAHAQIKTAPFPGVPEALLALRDAGVRLAVASNKPDAGVKRLAEHYFPGLFDAALGDRPGLRAKPCPDLLETAMGLLKTGPENTVYIGDSDVDILTARACGLPCVSVTWGYRGEDFLRASGAAAFAHTPDELVRAILGAVPADT